MAVLNNIRKHGIFLILIIALALFAFILSSVIQNGGFSAGKDQNTIGVVNGQDLSRIEFSNRMQVAQRNSQGRLTNIQAVNSVWDAMVSQTLLTEQINSLGIDVGVQQISHALALNFGQNPEFSTNGQFDINKFKAYIQRLQAVSPQAYAQWLSTEQQIIEQAKSNLYFDLAIAGLGTTHSQAKAAYQVNNTQFDLQYVKVPYASISNDKVSVSDSDIQQYINAHKKQFTSEGARSIRYVLFPSKASDADINEVKTQLADLLKDRKEFNQAAGVEETVKGFKNTTDYSNYLAEYSDLPYADFYLFKSEVNGQFIDTLFNLSEGEIYGPYKENGYWKYSKLVDKKQTPDSVKIKQILISYQGLATAQNTTRTQAEAEVLADSLATVLKADHSKFNELATTYSDDPSSKAKGGEIGWVAHQPGAVNPLITYAFNNPAGTIKVVETQFGFHVTYIEDTKDEKPAYKFATLAKKIEPSDETENLLFNQATKFQIKANEGDFAKAAQAQNYEIRPVKGLQPLDETITGIGNHRNIVQWAFEETTKPGDLKRFNTEQGYVVAQLTASSSKGLQTVEEAKAQVTPILLKEKKAAYVKSQINGTDLNAIASSFGTQVRTKNDLYYTTPNLEGNEPKVVGAAFGLAQGAVSAPITGNTGVYVIKVIAKDAPGELNSFNGLIYQKDQQLMQQAPAEIIEALKENAQITDRRAEFY